MYKDKKDKELGSTVICRPIKCLDKNSLFVQCQLRNDVMNQLEKKNEKATYP